TKWVNVHTHEVFFRDTAHGFLVWAVALVMTAAFLASAAASVIGGAGQASVAAASTGNAQSRESGGPNGYVIDTLLRTTPSSAERDNTSARAEIGVIMANGLREGSLSP